MKQISTKQAQRNAALARIKKTKPNVCIFCGNFCGNSDLIHLMNKQIYSQYYLEPLNVWKAHRFCHTNFDDHKEVRAANKRCIDLVKQFATDQEIYQYFGV